MGTGAGDGDRCRRWGQVQEMGTGARDGDRCKRWGQVQEMGTGAGVTIERVV